MGMQAFQKALGLPLQLYAPYFCDKSKYAQNFSMVASNASLADVFGDEYGAVTAVRAFAHQWRAGLDAIHLNVVRLFGDTSAASSSTASSTAALDMSSTQARTSTAAQVLKQVLTQLLLYYQRFSDLVKKHTAAAVVATGSAAPAAADELTTALRELVPFHTLMFEVKKFVNRS